MTEKIEVDLDRVDELVDLMEDTIKSADKDFKNKELMFATTILHQKSYERNDGNFMK